MEVQLAANQGRYEYYGRIKGQKYIREKRKGHISGKNMVYPSDSRFSFFLLHIFAV
jgi:hypothetical protein